MGRDGSHHGVGVNARTVVPVVTPENFHTFLVDAPTPTKKDEPNSVFCGYSTGTLSAAFDKVKSKTHWKNPVTAIIPVADFDVTSAAVSFYTGSELQWMREYKTGRNAGKVRVFADGYYRVIGS